MSDAEVGSGTIHWLADFFRLLEIDASDVAEHPDAIERLVRGELQGILVHHVYDDALLSQIVPRLERHDPPFLKTWFPDEFRSWFYGENLNLAAPDLTNYFREAARFAEHLRQLFPPGYDLEQQVMKRLSALDQGRPYGAPPGPQSGQFYFPTTLRAHLPGGFIPPHFDNEQALRPSYAHLMSLIDPHLLSFVLAFSLAEEGGALEIYDMRMSPLSDRALNVDGVETIWPDDSVASVAFRLPAGAMIIVDSGQFLHRVTPVIGEQKRWTACSFMARRRDHAAVYCWG